MSPEQCTGKPIDHRSDQYSLAVVVYQITTGHLPFESETPMGMAIKHVNEPLPLPRDVNPRIPKLVEAVLVKALSKNPDNRFISITEFNNAFQEAIEVSLDPDSVDKDWYAKFEELTAIMDPMSEPGASMVAQPVHERRRYLAMAALAVVILGCPSAALGMFGAQWFDNGSQPDYSATMTAISGEIAANLNEGIPDEWVPTYVAQTLTVLQATDQVRMTDESAQLTQDSSQDGGLGDTTPTAGVTVSFAVTGVASNETGQSTPVFSPTKTFTIGPTPTRTPTYPPAPTPTLIDATPTFDPARCRTDKPPDHPLYCTPTPEP
jgi:hypothetical protein